MTVAYHTRDVRKAVKIEKQFHCIGCPKIDRFTGIWEAVTHMKTTLEIPDTLYRQVKSKCSLDGRPVRSVTQRLYELWLAGSVLLDDSEDVHAAGKDGWARKWVRETDALADKIGKKSADARLNRDLLKDDRR